MAQHSMARPCSSSRWIRRCTHTHARSTPVVRCRAAAKQVENTHPWSWRGSEMHAERYLHELTPEDVRALDGAVRHARMADAKLVDIDETSCVSLFPLGDELSMKMTRIREDLVNGTGIALVRNIPVDRYSDADAALAAWGLAMSMGGGISAVPQNSKGHLLGHVRDLGTDPNDPATRIYTTSAAQPWHTDSADIVGLLCLQQAVEGGHSGVVSSTAVFDEVRRRDEDAANALLEFYLWDRKGEVPDGKAPFFGVPVFTEINGRMVSMHDRSFIDAAQRRFTTEDGVPRLTDRQIAALDLADAVADELQVKMTLAPGDLQLIHSHCTWHMRTEYVDGERRTSGRRRRHLLRLWLATTGDDAWSLPDAFVERYGDVDVGKVRGGIRCPGATPYAPLTPHG